MSHGFIKAGKKHHTMSFRWNKLLPFKQNNIMGNHIAHLFSSKMVFSIPYLSCTQVNLFLIAASVFIIHSGNRQTVFKECNY